MKISVKTREKIGYYNDRPKIFVVYHPKDYATYFEVLTEEILQISNSALFFVEPQELQQGMGMDEISLEMVESVQAVIIFVSRSFLEEKQFGLEYWSRHFIEGHVPIIPVMLEDGLISDFEEQMNAIAPGLEKMQFLRRCQQDVSEIPYMEKLKLRLDGILSNDETRKQVKEHLNGKIFISYRKVDRAYANKFMKMLHSIEGCRDISVWYDEFLTPGELWNNEIEQQIANADYFALLMTKNMVEGDNYVVRVEYPMAQKKIADGKANENWILGVELEKVSSRAVQEKFPGLTLLECDKIREALGKYVQNGDNNQPEHLYYVGLAFLEGIGMERDCERAKALIQEAAEQDFVDAMEKLVSMYDNGNGVPYNEAEAAKWAKRIAQSIEQLWEKEKTEGLRLEAFSKWHAAASRYIALGIVEEVNNCAMKLQAICEDDSVEADWRMNQEILIEVMGKLETLRGNYAVAAEWFTKGIREDASVSEVELWQAYEAKRNKSISLNEAADALLAIGGRENIAKACTYFEESIRVINEAVFLYGRIDGKSDIAAAWNGLGRAYAAGAIQEQEEAENLLFKALSCYEKSLKLMLEAEERDSGDTIKQSILVAYSAVGDALHTLRRMLGISVESIYGDEVSCYEKALELAEKLAKKATVQGRNDLAMVNEKLGLATGDRKFFKKALNIRLEVAKKHEVVDYAKVCRDLIVKSLVTGVFDLQSVLDSFCDGTAIRNASEHVVQKVLKVLAGVKLGYELQGNILHQLIRASVQNLENKKIQATGNMTLYKEKIINSTLFFATRYFERIALLEPICSGIISQEFPFEDFCFMSREWEHTFNAHGIHIAFQSEEPLAQGLWDMEVVQNEAYYIVFRLINDVMADVLKAVAREFAMTGTETEMISGEEFMHVMHVSLELMVQEEVVRYLQR